MPATHSFRAIIYKTGINFAVDVPTGIIAQLTAVKGYIRIKGTVNGIAFTKSLVPVKDGPYRLYINTITLKDICDRVGEVASFIIEPDTTPQQQEHPVPQALTERLNQHGLLRQFDELPFYRRKEIVRYLNSIKTPETFERNLLKLIKQMKDNEPRPHVP